MAYSKSKKARLAARPCVHRTDRVRRYHDSVKRDDGGSAASYDVIRQVGEALEARLEAELAVRADGMNLGADGANPSKVTQLTPDGRNPIPASGNRIHDGLLTKDMFLAGDGVSAGTVRPWDGLAAGELAPNIRI